MTRDPEKEKGKKEERKRKGDRCRCTDVRAGISTETVITGLSGLEKKAEIGRANSSRHIARSEAEKATKRDDTPRLAAVLMVALLSYGTAASRLAGTPHLAFIK